MHGMPVHPRIVRKTCGPGFLQLVISLTQHHIMPRPAGEFIIGRPGDQPVIVRGIRTHGGDAIALRADDKYRSMDSSHLFWVDETRSYARRDRKEGFDARVFERRN